MSNVKRRVFEFTILFLMILLIFLGSRYLLQPKEVSNFYKDEEYSGEISGKFFDEKGAEKITVNNQTYFTKNQEMFDLIKAGDRIIKAKGTTKFVVIRMTDTFIFYPQANGKNVIN